MRNYSGKMIKFAVESKRQTMKRLILALIIAIAGAANTCLAADGDLFPYPVPPEDMETLGERCDYLVTHFWDRCSFRTAFSAREKLNNCFGDWISFMPYATADSVHVAIDRLLEQVKKSGPHTLALARMAEGWTYTDTTAIFSEEIYYPFAKAAAEHRKISDADKARFKSHVRIIDNTRRNERVGHLEYTLADGSHQNLDSVKTQIIVIIFNDHDCDNCALARLRLSADINATALLKAGLLTVLCIQPGEATEEWKLAAQSYPVEWVNAVSKDADEYFPLRTSPEFYLLDSRHRLLAKDFDIDGLLAALSALRTNTGI